MDNDMDIRAFQAGDISVFPTFAPFNNGTTVLLWQDQ
jgi:hypothetical protein